MRLPLAKKQPRTIEQIESSPYFARWVEADKETDYPIPRTWMDRLRGRRRYRKPTFRTMTEEEAGAMAFYGDWAEFPMATAEMTVAMADGTRKTVPNLKWLRETFGKMADRNLGQLYNDSGWVYACVSIRADMLATFPIEIYDLANDEAKEGHELEARLKEFNPEVNWTDAIKGVESDLCIYGKAAWKKIRKGQPSIFWQRLIPEQLEIKYTDKGEFAIKYQGKTLERQDVVLWRLYDPNGESTPVSPLYSVRRKVRAEIEADKQLAAFFENGAMPPIIFSVPTTDQAQINKIAAAWQRKYGGSNNTGKTAFVGGDAKPQPVGYNLKELALSETREELRQGICSALRVPPTMVGAWNAANYAVSDKDRRSFISETMMTEAMFIAEVIHEQIAAEYGVGFRFNLEEVASMQADKLLEAQTRQADATALQIAVQAGAITPEKMAEEMGFEPQDVNQNMIQDIRKYRTKALKAFKSGKNPNIKFYSEVIPETTLAAIRTQLANAETIDDVNSAFAD